MFSETSLLGAIMLSRKLGVLKGSARYLLGVGKGAGVCGRDVGLGGAEGGLDVGRSN